MGSWNPSGRDALEDAPPPERRQVTVLFADLAGFTALSRQTDPEEMVEILGRYFQVVDTEVLRHGGRLDKHIGDAVMAVFGAPVAHGDEPRRAVRAALAIHRGLEDLSAELDREIVAHIGIATGEVLAGRVGSDHLARYTVLGDAANLASRLDALAEARQTLVSDETRAAVGDAGLFEAHGNLAVKGFEEPLPVWRLVGLRTSPGPSRALVGRGSELHLLDQVMAEGGIAWLEGDPGIGKSRLLEAAGARAVASGRIVVSLALPPSAVTESDRLQTRLARAVVAHLSGESDALFLGLVDRAGEHGTALWDLLLWSAPPEVAGLLAATRQDTRAARRSGALTWLLQQLAVRPACVVIDDVQHLDPADRGDLALQVEQTAGLPLVWLLAGRTLAHAPLAARGGSMHLRLAPLDASASLELAQTLAASLPAATPTHIETAAARALGNPFFLEELLRSPEGAPVPGTVQSVVLARLDRLDADAKRAIQTAAALGKHFPAALLAHCLDVATAPETLIDTGFLQRDGDRLVFVQELLREGAYAAALRAHRREVHRAAAAWFGADEPELRAGHLEQADDPGAARAWLEAARQRHAALRTEHARVLTGRGLAVATRPEDTWALQLYQAQLLNELSKPAQAAELLVPLLDRDPSPADHARILVELGESNRLLARSDRNEDVIVNRAEPLARAHGTDEVLARCLILKGSFQFLSGDHGRMLETLEEARRVAARTGDTGLELRAESGLGDVHWARGTWDSAYYCFDRTVRLARQHNLPSVEAANLMMIAAVRFMRGDPTPPEPELERAVMLSRQMGTSRSEILFLGDRGSQLAWRRRFTEADDRMAQARAAVARSGLTNFGPVIDAYESGVLFWSGRRREALEVVRRCRQVIERSVANVFLLSLLGIEAACAPDPAARELALAQAREREAQAIGLARVNFYAVAIEGALERAEHDSVIDLAGRLEASFPDEPNMLSTLLVQRARLLAAPTLPDRERVAALSRRIEAAGFEVLLPRLAEAG